jgi:hypothetical protein
LPRGSRPLLTYQHDQLPASRDAGIKQISLQHGAMLGHDRNNDGWVSGTLALVDRHRISPLDAKFQLWMGGSIGVANAYLANSASCHRAPGTPGAGKVLLTICAAPYRLEANREGGMVERSMIEGRTVLVTCVDDYLRPVADRLQATFIQITFGRRWGHALLRDRHTRCRGGTPAARDAL